MLSYGLDFLPPALPPSLLSLHVCVYIEGRGGRRSSNRSALGFNQFEMWCISNQFAGLGAEHILPGVVQHDRSTLLKEFELYVSIDP
eukprot:c37235_g1_i1 orf=1-261(+)